MKQYEWDDLRRSRGPADWDWGQALGAVLLAIGLVGFGIVLAGRWQPREAPPIKPPMFIKEMSAGRSAVREVRDIETASAVHLAWPGRGAAWPHAAEVLSEALLGKATPEAARVAFVAAAEEASVHVDREL